MMRWITCKYLRPACLSFFLTNRSNVYMRSQKFTEKSYCSLKNFSFKSVVQSTLLTTIAFIPIKADSSLNLFQVIKNGDLHAFKKNFKNEYSKQRHEFGWSLLLTAVVNHQIEIVKFLLNNGANVNERDFYAGDRKVAESKRYNIQTVRTSRYNEFSDELDTRVNFNGSTALHYAVLLDDYKMVEFLLNNHADPTIRNSKGYTPIELALPRIKQLLKSYEQEFLKKKSQLEREERRKYSLENKLKENLVGQEAAIDIVASTIKRKENGWFDDKHPLVMLFLGSSGIGKTETAKQIASYIHKEENISKGFIRIDMSEYQEKHSISRFIGAPPGYIGYDKGGQLTKGLTECPDAVVLFDEVEKAHPDILTVLLQLFDEGRMTDGQGKTIECKNAIFIMTSNVASEIISEHAQRLREANSGSKKNIEIDRDFKDRIMRPILKRHFLRDEFLGRINEMVYFLPFTHSEIAKLTSVQLEYWRQIALVKHGVELTWNNEVVDYLAHGYDAHYGARSIKYEVERKVITGLAEAFESGRLDKDDKVELTMYTMKKDDDEDVKVSRIKMQIKDGTTKKVKADEILGNRKIIQG